MTERKYQSYTKVTTAPGVAIYPKLNIPDTKFKPLGEYQCKLKLSADEAAPIIQAFDVVLEAHFKAEQEELMKGDGKSKAKAKAMKYAADKPFKPNFDDEGNETGEIIFNFKMPARIVREGKEDLILKPDFFTADGRKLAGNIPEIWGGSKLSIAAELRPFHTAIGVGVSLRLMAVQIIELRTKGSNNSAGYGFASHTGYGGDEAPALSREEFDQLPVPPSDDDPF
jgi:hypothetical protein